MNICMHAIFPEPGYQFKLALRSRNCAQISDVAVNQGSQARQLIETQASKLV